MRTIYITLIITGLLMAVFGLIMFGTKTDSYTLSVLGKYSFMLWLPVLIAGFVMRVIVKDKK